MTLTVVKLNDTIVLASATTANAAVMLDDLASTGTLCGNQGSHRGVSGGQRVPGDRGAVRVEILVAHRGMKGRYDINRPTNSIGCLAPRVVTVQKGSAEHALQRHNYCAICWSL